MTGEAVVMPDLEAALIAFLLDDFALADHVVGRIYAELPPEPTYPLVTLVLLSARGRVPRWLDAGTVTVTGWGSRAAANGRKDARDALAYALAALNTIANTTVGDAVLCGPVATFEHGSLVDRIGEGLSNPRFIADVSLTFHPAAVGS